MDRRDFSVAILAARLPYKLLVRLSGLYINSEGAANSCLAYPTWHKTHKPRHSVASQGRSPITAQANEPQVCHLHLHHTCEHVSSVSKTNSVCQLGFCECRANVAMQMPPCGTGALYK